MGEPHPSGSDPSAFADQRRARIQSLFAADRLAKASRTFEPFPMTGRVHKALGTILQASVPDIRVGELVELQSPGAEAPLLAECVGFSDHLALLAPIGETTGVSHLTEVHRTSAVQQVAVGEGLLGRVLNPLGEVIDGQGPFVAEARYPLHADPPPALARRLITKPLAVGVRAIDGLLTCGEGQRVGIFAPAGVGNARSAWRRASRRPDAVIRPLFSPFCHG